MDDNAIRAAIFRVLARIAPEADPAHLAPGERLRPALDLDSFDFLNLMVGLKRELGVEVPEADYGRVGSLGELVEYLRRRLDAGASNPAEKSA